MSPAVPVANITVSSPSGALAGVVTDKGNGRYSLTLMPALAKKGAETVSLTVNGQVTTLTVNLNAEFVVPSPKVNYTKALGSLPVVIAKADLAGLLGVKNADTITPTSLSLYSTENTATVVGTIKVDASTGAVTLTPYPDYARYYATAEFLVSGLPTTQQKASTGGTPVKLILSGINAKPADMLMASFGTGVNPLENVGVLYTIDVQQSRLDSSSNIFTYTLTPAGKDNARFTFTNGTTLTNKGSFLSYSTNYEIEVSVADNSRQVVLTKKFTINIPAPVVAPTTPPPAPVCPPGTSVIGGGLCA